MPIRRSRLSRVLFHSLISTAVRGRGTLWAAPVALVTASYMLSGDALDDPNPRIFLDSDLAQVACHLESHRPPALSEEGKLRIIRSLPSKGEVTNLSASQRRKVLSLQPLLGPAEHPAYQFKVIDVPQAFSGLYERAVLLISFPALTLWNSEELQAIVAHEIGHEYVWPQYQAALRERQSSRLQKLELYCDGIAILALHRHGIDPSYLIVALEKAIRYNRNRYGRALNENDYPTLEQRRQFHQQLIASLKERSKYAEQQGMCPIASPAYWLPPRPERCD